MKMKENNIKVSVIMPSLNVAQYIRECMESVVNQTLQEIEIICVDAGSTDGTLEILQEYERRDSRIRVIGSARKSYGYQMNLGMDAAQGTYIGIVETDDCIRPEMYAELYKKAIENRADLVKSDYYIFSGEASKRNLVYTELTGNASYYGKIIDPKKDVSVFNLAMVTCTGLYRRAYLRKNKVRYNETPGASYQDNGFWHQSFYFADRIYFLRKAFYCYRQDNENSSINNHGNIFAGRDEYRYIYNVLETHQELKKIFIYIYTYRKFHNFNYNLGRVADEFKLEFLKSFQQEFLKSEEKGELDWTLFSEGQCSFLRAVMSDPERIYSELCGIPVVFATNNNYAPYLGVAIGSLIKYADKSKYYSISILHTKLTSGNQQKLQGMSTRNVRIKCIHAGEYLPNTNLYEKDRFTEEMYFRILIPEIFSQQEKVLYLDCDLVLCADAAKLYEVDIKGYVMGMGHNFCTEYRAGYVKNILKLHPEKYFNSGVILFNCKRFREEGMTSKCFSLLEQYPNLECPDQDILNLACGGRVFPLDSRWNVGWQHKIQLNPSFYTEDEKELYDTVTETPYIVHFTSGIKPWNEPERIWSYYFWEIARTNIYYEEILFKAISIKCAVVGRSNGKTQHEADLIRASTSYRIGRFITFIPRKVRGGLRCFKEHGWRYTWRRVLVHLGLKEDPCK